MLRSIGSPIPDQLEELILDLGQALSDPSSPERGHTPAEPGSYLVAASKPIHQVTLSSECVRKLVREELAAHQFARLEDVQLLVDDSIEEANRQISGKLTALENHAVSTAKAFDSKLDHLTNLLIGCLTPPSQNCSPTSPFKGISRKVAKKPRLGNSQTHRICLETSSDLQ